MNARAESTRNALCSAILAKIDEQIERTDHLISLLPEDHLDWKPGQENFFTVGALLDHLLECLAGFCAVLSAAEPERLRHFSALRQLSRRGCGDPAGTRARVEVYRAGIEEGFALLRDTDLSRLVPTVFVTEGEPLLTLLLGNLEHLVNHKHQLYMYLKLMGTDVSSRDLYRFRDKGSAGSSETGGLA